jgi:hypothetical protein
MTPRFLPRFTCLPASYVLVVEIYSLGGSCTYRHHTPNPQLSAAQPTQDEDPQATSNPQEYLLALRWGKVKNPSQIQLGWLRTITESCQSPRVAPSHLNGGNHPE